MKKLCEDMAMSMYREGRLDREIAEAIGYSRVSVTNWRKSRGLPPNRRWRPEKMLDAYKAAMPLERVQELSQAEKDGRLVVLPCKLHESIFYLKDGSWYDDVPYDVYIGQKQGEWNDSLLYECEDGFSFYAEEVGKTVFLTRAEAEAALKKREETDNEH